MTIQPAILNSSPAIRLHIKRLVLDGLPLDRASGPRLQAALETELGRLFAEQGLPAAMKEGAALSQVNGPVLNLAAGGKPTVLGAQIAQAVYGGLGP